MIAALKQVEAGRAVEDVAREVGVSKHTIYSSRNCLASCAWLTSMPPYFALAAEAGGGSGSGQRSAAVGDPKKRLELVALKAAIGQMRAEYAFSECRLMTVAVSSFRYETKRTDKPLRTQLVELAREKPLALTRLSCRGLASGLKTICSTPHPVFCQRTIE